MEEFTLIQLRLPNEFNYKLEVYLAKLKRDGHVKKGQNKSSGFTCACRIRFAE